MLHQRSARLAAWQIWTLSLSGAGLWLTGAIWLVLHYFFEIEGEYGTETNPLEPWMLKIHGLLLIPALLALGGLLVVHIPKGWRQKSQRSAGLILTAILIILILSGYLLYYAGDADLRQVSSLVHWLFGLFVPAAFIWHRTRNAALRRKHKRR